MEAELAEGSAAHGWEVRGRSRRRISIAALARYKPGHRSRPIYRPRRDDGHRDGRKSFSWRVLVWDDLDVHKVAGLREFAESGAC
ncbi:hypothetical protein GCM10023220_13640 [Streptomyces ziwulingensis]|uniref:Transposase n=1 Tax=Streptomyces ziwulingensis TaxID=1045501 RepID=A0ABP9B4N8_9ACTN